jgi:hypothetical protein
LDLKKLCLLNPAVADAKQEQTAQEAVYVGLLK